MQVTQETLVWTLIWEDPPEVRNGNPLQYSCLEIFMDRGAWLATVHGATESWIWLSDFLHFFILFAPLTGSFPMCYLPGQWFFLLRVWIYFWNSLFSMQLYFLTPRLLVFFFMIVISLWTSHFPHVLISYFSLIICLCFLVVHQSFLKWLFWILYHSSPLL